MLQKFVFVDNIKVTYSTPNLWALFYVINISPSIDTYIYISRQTASYITRSSICFPSVSLLTFHSHLTFPSSHSQQLRSHSAICAICSTSCCTFLLCFPTATSTRFVYLSVTPHINYLCTYKIKIKTQHTFRNAFQVVTVIISTQFEYISQKAKWNSSCKAEK
jgi:hypothetical protein